VRADGVVDALPVAQGLTGAGQIQVPIVVFPELLGMGLLSPFDVAIELRRAGRQDEEADTCLPTGFLEVGHELRAAVHLNGLHLERRPSPESAQEVGGRAGGGPGVHLDYIPAADDVTSGELFANDARQGAQVKGVYLHQIARGLRPIALRLPGAIGTPGASSAGGDGSSWRFP
jgi:hypothetical protein